jgi:hypothetical protein
MVVCMVALLVPRASAKGDSLSPLLFVIVMEALSKMLLVGGYLYGFRVDLQNTISLEITYLLFADDTIIMCDAYQDQILNL